MRGTNNYLSLWARGGWETEDDYFNGISLNPNVNRLDYAASDYFRKVQPGDRVFIHARFPKLGYCLLGRIIVGAVCDRVEGEKRRPGDLWTDGDWHVFAKQGTAKPYLLIPINRLLPKLTAFNYGKVKPFGPLTGTFQFRAVRHLTTDSAEKLDNLIKEKLAAF